MGFGVDYLKKKKKNYEQRISWSHDKFLVQCLGMTSRCCVSQGLSHGGAEQPDETEEDVL